MIKLLQKWVINTFGFSKSESNGSIILVFLVIIIAVFPRLFINKTVTHEVSYNHDSITLKKWFEASQLAFAEEKNREEKSQTSEVVQFNPSPFNPNNVRIDELIAYGIPKNAAENLVRYRSAGGSFSIKSDLQKIYGLDNNTYEKLREFIILPEVKPPIDNKIETPDDTGINIEVEKKSLPSIDINRAAAHELQRIRGIGPKLSERITKYRELLGGFHSHNQLSEVYGLSEEILQKLHDQITIDEQAINQLKINSATLQELTAHPYIDYSLGKVIINYRNVHGPYAHNSDIKNIKIVSDSLFNKISPYISIRPD